MIPELSQTGNVVDVVGPSLQARRERLLEDKFGVRVTKTIDMGQIVCGQDVKSEELVINNDGTEPRSIRAAEFDRHDQIYLSEPFPISIGPKSQVPIKVFCRPEVLGTSEELLVLDFRDFKIGALIKFEAVDPIAEAIYPKQDSQWNRSFGSVR